MTPRLSRHIARAAAAAAVSLATLGARAGEPQVPPLSAGDFAGIEALYARTLHDAEASTGTRHWLTNLVMEPAPGGALAWPYIVRSRGAEMALAVLYRDRLVRDGDSWRIVEHEEHPGTVMPPREHVSAPANESSRVFTAQDFAEIKRLISRYNLGYDNAAPFDGGILSSLSFTLDALFERPGGATRRGRREAVIQALEFQKKPGLHHWDSNLLVDIAPNGDVTSVNYDMQFNVAEGGAPVRLNGAGLLHHRFVRTAEGWLIKYRRYDGLTQVPDQHWPVTGYGIRAAQIQPASGDAPGAGLSAGDYAEIEQLYSRNSFALDSAANGGADFARTFVEDGVLVRGATATGHRALAALAAGQPPTLRHWTTNLTVVPAASGATGRVYVLTFTPGSPGTVNDVGHFDDQLVRTPDGWRFQRRTYRSDGAR